MLIWILLWVRHAPNKWADLKARVPKNLYIPLVIWFVFVCLEMALPFRISFRHYPEEVMLKLPLLIVPIYASLLPKDTCTREKSWLVFAVMTTIVAVISTINYGINYEEINQLLLQSKHVPVFGNMHHIYFGIYMSLAIWISVSFYSKGTYKKVWLVIALSLFVMMHILASRTGLVAFYASIVGYLIFYTWQQKKFKTLLIGLAVLIAVPFFGYQFSTSLRNKVANSIEDFQAISSGEDINYKSLAMRMEAWKTGWHIVQDYWATGVGASQVEKYMNRQYDVDGSVLYKENRVGPHNQFLEITISHGILGFVLLMFLVIVWLKRIYKSPVSLAIAIVFLISFLLESFLERQQGILIFCLVIFSFIDLPSRNHTVPDNV